MRRIFLLFGLILGALSIQGATCTQTFTVSGNDDDPTILTITAASLSCMPPGAVVTGMALANSSGSLMNSNCVPFGGWFDFEVYVDGGTGIQACGGAADGTDITGFTSLQIVSWDNDAWSDGVTITIDVEVTYTCSQTFTVSGNDDDPTVLTITSAMVTCFGGPGDLLILNNSAGSLLNGNCVPFGGWFDFEVSVDGGPGIQACGGAADGTDITGFSSLQIVSWDNDAWSDGVTITIDVEVYTAPACADPADLTGSGFTLASADLSWTENGSATLWDVEYGAPGFTQGTGTVVSAGSNPYTLGGLAAGTSYDYYVRADCGGGLTSAYVGPFAFTTDYCTAPIAAYPYNEDFEGGAGGWFDNRSSTAGVWALGTPAQFNLNAAASGVNAWMTDLAANYPTNLDAYVENCFDFSSLTAPELSLGVNYDTEGGWDGSNVQYSEDAGATWSVLGGDGDPNNWYNDTDVDGLNNNEDGWSGASGGWLTARHEMVAQAGLADVRIRVAFGSDGSGVDEGMAFDDVSIKNLSCIDPAALTAANITTSAADLGWTELGTSSTWEIEYGPVGFALGAGTVVAAGSNPFTLTGLAAGTSYDFYVRSDCGVLGTSAWVGPLAFATDYCATPINTFPYSEDFESGAGQWTDNGSSTAGAWELGTPAQANLNAAASGTNAWMTDLNANYATNLDVYVENCFDFTSLPFPELTLGVNYDSETNWDGSNVQVSTDGGSTWGIIGAEGDPNNWYNNTDVDGLNNGEDGWSGASGGWLTANHEMNAQGGLADVRIRVAFGSDGSGVDEGMAFDDVSILSVACVDPTVLTATSVTGTSADLGWTENGSAVLWNIEYGALGFTLGSGTATITGAATNPYNLTGLTPAVTYDFYVQSDCGVPGQSAWVGPFTFTTDYCVTAINTFPYSEDFESGAGGWTDNGSSNSGVWALGTPAQTNINAAGSGVNAWMTDLSANYPTNLDAFVENCFDFTSLSAPELSLGVNYDSEGGWDGSNVQVSTDGGSTWGIVGAFGDPNNWYNDADVDGLNNNEDGWSGASGGWLTARHEVVAQAGLADVRIRVAFGSDASGVDEGMAFDDVSILDITCSDPTALTAVNVTTVSADLGWTENGTSLVWDVEYGPEGFTLGAGTATITGAATNPYNLAGLTPGVAYDFYVRSDCGVLGFSAWAGPFTFTTDYCVTAINSFPYSEDFESGAGGWTDNGSSTSGVWELGAPAQVNLNTANSGINAWMTDLAANYPTNLDAYVENCFDFTSVTAPELSLGVNYDTEGGWDGSNVQYSIDAGSTWSILGVFGDPNNWYDDGDVDGLNNNEDGWSGASGGWLTARHDMNAQAGEVDVRIRVAFGSDASGVDEGMAFDDVSIQDITCVDPSALSATKYYRIWCRPRLDGEWYVCIVGFGVWSSRIYSRFRYSYNYWNCSQPIFPWGFNRRHEL